MASKNRLKAALGEDRVLFGTFVQIPDGAVVEIAAAVGLDYVIIDMQHGPIGLETAGSLIRAAEASGIAPLVRVPSVDPVMIGQVLDLGALSIAVPDVSSVAEAEQVIRAMKYPPAGNRGACSVVRGVGYRAKPGFSEEVNRDTLAYLALEGKQALEDLDAILALDGLDVIVVGTYDLSFSLGVGGQREHPTVRNTIRSILQRAREEHVTTAMLVYDAAEAQVWLDEGVRMITASLDARVLYDAYGTLVGSMRALDRSSRA